MEKSQDVSSVVVRAGGDVVGSRKPLYLKIPSQNSGDQMLFLQKGQKCFPFFPMQTCAQHLLNLILNPTVNHFKEHIQSNSKAIKHIHFSRVTQTVCNFAMWVFTVECQV